MALVQQIKSPQARMWMQSARFLWTEGKRESAIAFAVRVYRAEGRGVFGTADAELLAAALAHIAQTKKKRP